LSQVFVHLSNVIVAYVLDTRDNSVGVFQGAIIAASQNTPTTLARHTTDPNCLYCKLLHLSTDRDCREWITQMDIKKIMATENISY